jgi:dihydrofolate reductase
MSLRIDVKGVRLFEKENGRVNHMKTEGGSGLAAQAIKAGLIDECHLLVAPILLLLRQHRCYELFQLIGMFERITEKEGHTRFL